MSHPFSEANSAPGHPGQPVTVTLIPLQTDRQAALPPDPNLAIAAARLTKVLARWHNAFNELTTRQADDLFACAAREGSLYDPVPLGAEIVEADLDFQFFDRPEPAQVRIKPPHTLILEDSPDSARILSYLRHRGFLDDKF